MVGKGKVLIIFIFFIGLIFWAGSRCGPSSDSQEPSVKLYLNQRHTTITIPLEEYLVGVVGAEMPVSFGSQALQAQTVTARTYTLKRLYAPVKHTGGAQMCDDIHCCQAYIDPQDYRREFGQNGYDARFIPVRRAVEATRAQVMLYKQQLIDTPYFSTCGGHTAAAAEVWGRDVPYLQSVTCPYCQKSQRYNNQITISLKQVNRALKQPDHKKFQLSSKIVTASGRLRSVVVDGQRMSGVELRQLFDLPSTQITQAKQRGNQVTFTCRGYGHGVGLCQYGSAGMGQKGYHYQQILQHYYQGIQVVKLNY